MSWKHPNDEEAARTLALGGLVIVLVIVIVLVYL